MKAITVQEAQTRLGELIAQACRGELVLVTDGDKQVTLEPRVLFEPDKDSPELEAELLKGIDGPFAPYSSEEMRGIGECIIGKKQGK